MKLARTILKPKVWSGQPCCYAGCRNFDTLLEGRGYKCTKHRHENATRRAESRRQNALEARLLKKIGG